MYVSPEELQRLVEAIHKPSIHDDQIVGKLLGYDEAIINAVKLRTRLELNFELEAIEEANFRRCHQLIVQNQQLQGRVSELQSMLLDASKDRELLRFERERAKGLEMKLQQAKQLAAFTDEVYSAIDDIENTIQRTVDSEDRTQQTSACNSEDHFIVVERQRLELIRIALQERSNSQNDMDVITRDLLDSNRQRLRLQQETIEALCEELTTKHQPEPVDLQGHYWKQLQLAEKELIKNYQSQIKRLSKQEGQHRKIVESLELRISGQKELADKALQERELLRIENINLREKIDVLMAQRTEYLSNLTSNSLSEKEEAISKIKSSVATTNSTVADLRKEIFDLQERTRDLEATHSAEVTKLKAGNTRHIDILKGEINQLRLEHERTITKLNKERHIELSQIETRHKRQRQRLSVNTLQSSHSRDELSKLNRRISQLSKEVQQLRSSNETFRGQVVQANGKSQQFLNTIKGLELELSRRPLKAPRPQRQPEPKQQAVPQPTIPAVTMRDLNDIINLLTFVR